MKAMKVVALLGAVLAMALSVSESAFAVAPAAVDVADLVTGISNQLTPIGSVGLGVLGVVLAIKTYKWIRRAF